MSTPGYLIFHLNLAFSAVPTAARARVVEKCYWPLLGLAEDLDVPLGVELTGWTLAQIKGLDPAWVERFAGLLRQGRCELIGSGWTQAIGPLMPCEANRWNQRLGIESYAEILGARPRLALVNEMAFSTGLVDLYREAGYEGLVMDRDNVRLALGLSDAPLSSTPTHALGALAAGGGESSRLPVLWSDSILFQRLQRVVHGDIPMAEYLDYVRARAGEDGAPLPIYCNDAEIFDYRPGRFEAESRLHPEGEWERLRRVCQRLRQDLGIAWLSPSQALAAQETQPHRPAVLSSVSHPLPVKKQAKYNINRWAVTGRDDLWLNTSCHRLAKALEADAAAGAEDWRELCELWASDLRTHITQDRWDEGMARLDAAMRRRGLAAPDAEQPRPQTGDAAATPAMACLPPGVRIEQDEEGLIWTIETPTARLRLNARRGLAVKSLGFASQGFAPVLGTLPQGFFRSIELGADFYSGGVLIEIPGERTRMTDLEWVTPDISVRPGGLVISAALPLARGVLRKTLVLSLDEELLQFTYAFEDVPRPLGIVRVGIMTLLPGYFTAPLTVRCTNGGPGEEAFVLNREANHGQAASALVSSSSALGATEGRVGISDADGRGLAFTWDPAACAVAPMLKHLHSHDRWLTRLSFSLCELDDTTRPGGRLLPFTVAVRP